MQRTGGRKLVIFMNHGIENGLMAHGRALAAMPIGCSNLDGLDSARTSDGMTWLLGHDHLRLLPYRPGLPRPSATYSMGY